MVQIGKQSPRFGAKSHVAKYSLFMAAFSAFFIFGGGGIDMTRAYFAEDRLQAAAAETAAILAAKPPGATLYGLQMEAEKRMAVEIAGIADPQANVYVTVVGRDVRVNASGGLPTAFLRLIRRDRLPVEVTVTGIPPRGSRNIAWWV